VCNRRFGFVAYDKYKKYLQLLKTAPEGGSNKRHWTDILFGINVSRFVRGNLILDHVAQFFILPALYCVKEKPKVTRFRKYSLGLRRQNQSKLNRIVTREQ